jgi:hypothetical protein
MYTRKWRILILSKEGIRIEKIALFHLYMCVKQFHMKCNGKTFMCLLCVHGIRHKKVFFLLLSFLFMPSFFLKFSQAFCRPNGKKAFFLSEEISRCQWKGKKYPQMVYEIYTCSQWEFKDVYFVILFYFFFSFYPSAPPIHPHTNLIWGSLSLFVSSAVGTYMNFK